MTPQMASTMTGMLVGLAAIARFIWKWEKTFTDSAIEELKFLRAEVKRLRSENDDLYDRLNND